MLWLPLAIAQTPSNKPAGGNSSQPKPQQPSDKKDTPEKKDNSDKKEAAEGAALGALTAYLMESGRGHELNLPKGAKLELELERALYLVKE